MGNFMPQSLHSIKYVENDAELNPIQTGLSSNFLRPRVGGFGPQSPGGLNDDSPQNFYCKCGLQIKNWVDWPKIGPVGKI